VAFFRRCVKCRDVQYLTRFAVSPQTLYRENYNDSSAVQTQCCSFWEENDRNVLICLCRHVFEFKWFNFLLNARVRVQIISIPIKLGENPLGQLQSLTGQTTIYFSVVARIRKTQLFSVDYHNFVSSRKQIGVLLRVVSDVRDGLIRTT
jgi:hypothetical protein